MNEYSWGLQFSLLLVAIFNVAIGLLSAVGSAPAPLVVFQWLGILFLLSSAGCGVAIPFQPQRRITLLYGLVYSVALAAYNGFISVHGMANV